jgi:hypothetical protein
MASKVKETMASKIKRVNFIFNIPLCSYWQNTVTSDVRIKYVLSDVTCYYILSNVLIILLIVGSHWLCRADDYHSEIRWYRDRVCRRAFCRIYWCSGNNWCYIDGHHSRKLQRLGLDINDCPARVMTMEQTWLAWILVWKRKY